MDSTNNIINEKLLKERIIFIDKKIDEKISSDIVAKLLYLDSINNDDIHIIINSPGGDVDSGFMIYDTIKAIKSDVQTLSAGTAASVAAIILLAGTKGKRKILKNSKVMFHDIFIKLEAKYNEAVIHINEMKKVHDKLYKIITDNTNFTLDEVKRNLVNDFWLNSEEAVKYGVVDEIVD